MLRFGFYSKMIYVIFAALLVAGCGGTSKPKSHSIVGSDAPGDTTSTTSDNGTTSTTSTTSDTDTTTGGASAKDVVPPDTSIVSGPSGLVNSKAASFTFTGKDDVKVAGFACRLNTTSWASCASPKVYSNLVDAAYTFEVRAVDSSGNVDASPATSSWQVDTLPPDTSFVSGASGSVSSTSNGFVFACNEGSCSYQCAVNGSVFGGCSSPYNFVGQLDGSDTLQVRAVDAAGNTDPTPATSTWTVDTLPPDTSIDSAPSALTNTNSAMFTFSSVGGLTFECDLDGGGYAPCTTPKSYSGLGNVLHTFSVRATDAAGNTDATPATSTWTVDATPPDTSFVSGASGAVSSTSNSFVFACNESSCSYQCALNGGAFAGCSTPYAFAGQTDATYTLQVRATDAAGNTDASPVGVSWTVDTLPPVANISDGPASTTSTTTATDAHFVFGCNEVGCATWCAMDGVTATTCSSSMDVTGLTTNLHTFAVTAVDLAGNATTSVTSQTWRIITVPESYWRPIPGGMFIMGDAFHEGDSQELPAHIVTLSPFEMMSYEVTNGTYADCVAASSCTVPGNLTSYSGRNPYYGNATYANYPVIYVNWQQAANYCTWAGGRLPTEAEWEYAARGGLAAQRFPWGDTIDCSKANYSSNTSYSYDTQGSTGFCATPGDTTQVGSYAANGYGLYDMAGNVFDWVNDWYGSSYYSSSPVTDPQGPATGSYRVIRGGYFFYVAFYVRVAFRNSYFPSAQYYALGFRCAR